MVAPVQKDSLTDYQVALATYLRISSPVAGMFTGSEIKPNPNARSIRVPDIRVDDYIVDADIARIGANHYSGSEFTGEWKNGIPPIVWREYSMSRHRSFGFTVFDEQLRYSPIKNIVQEYTGRKMQTTVVRDHDKYCLLAAVSGHMTGKLVPRVTGTDTPGPVTTGANRIACTGNAADYKWIAEPGEDYDNQIQPSFATIKGMFMDNLNPLSTLDALTLLFSDNWFDSNFGNNERFLLITSAMELVFINALIDKGSATESAFKLMRDGDISGANANGYLGTLKGSWKLVKIHPEFLPKVYTDANLVVDPVADSTMSNPPTIAAPVLNAPTTATTGGTLAAGTYYYKITALNANGETTGSNEVSQVTTGATSTVGLTWAAVPGATGYKVYRSTTAGGQSTSPALVATLGAVTSYTDTGTAAAAGAVPAANGTAAAPTRFLRQVVALAAYKNAIQTYEHFSERRQQDGGTRFKGTEYVQDFSYDCWVIDQLSEGVVPMFLPATLTNLKIVDDSFTYVAAQVAAARAQLGVSPKTYPLSGPDTLKSSPEWFTSPYNATARLNTGLAVQKTGDVAHIQ